MLFSTTVVVLLLLTQIKAQAESPICGRLGPNIIPLITNSYHTHHWPWHAAIFHERTEINSGYVCGGTVISSNLILTAAHCVSVNNVQLDVESISVYLGRLNLVADESSSQYFKASTVYVHQNFSSIDYVHDIAIVKLSAHATFNNYVQPICLWNSNETDLSNVIGKSGTVVGWGKSTETGQKSNVLQAASMPVVSWGTCLKSNTDVFGRLLSDTNYCAGFHNGTSVCQGDSGGSMTFKVNGHYYIRGIVSVSPGKINHEILEVVCDSLQYAIFTDVAKYLPWIENIMSGTVILDFFTFLAEVTKAMTGDENNKTANSSERRERL